MERAAGKRVAGGRRWSRRIGLPASGRGRILWLALTTALWLPMVAAVAGEGSPRCGHCQRSACPQCRLGETAAGRHRECRHGLCPAHCPVRPDVFGFYGTRWRRWPGERGGATTDDDAATPVRPPRAEVPGADEESLPDPDPASSGERTERLPEPAATDAGVTKPAEPRSAETIDRAVPGPTRGPPGPDDAAASSPLDAAPRSRPWRSFTSDDRVRLAADP